MLQIEYRNNAGYIGKVNLNLDFMFPALESAFDLTSRGQREKKPVPAATFKKVAEIAAIATEPETAVKALSEIIILRINQVDAIVKEVKQQSGENGGFYKDIAAAGKDVSNKYHRFLEVLEKETGIAIEKPAAPEKVKMTAGSVYTMTGKHGAAEITIYDGWHFTKAGFSFSVHKESAGYYVITVDGTGLKIADCKNRKNAPDTITDKLLSFLNSNAEKLQQLNAEFIAALQAAGLDDVKETITPAPIGAETTTAEPEPETTTAEPEPETTTAEPENRDFAAEDITGVSITPRNTVVIFLNDGRRIRITDTDEDYVYARRIADAWKPAETVTEEPEPEPAPAADESETVTTEAETVIEKPETVTEKTAAAEPAEPSLYGVNGAEKHFIGTVISGAGWSISFSDKTRVKFDKMPPVVVRNAVKAAGFHWAPAEKTWNKGITWKAYRAALSLAELLRELMKAAA